MNHSINFILKNFFQRWKRNFHQFDKSFNLQTNAHFQKPPNEQRTHRSHKTQSPSRNLTQIWHAMHTCAPAEIRFGIPILSSHDTVTNVHIFSTHHKRARQFTTKPTARSRRRATFTNAHRKRKRGTSQTTLGRARAPTRRGGQSLGSPTGRRMIGVARVRARAASR